MIDKQKILDKYVDKEDKIFVNSILDKIAKFQKLDSIICTNFLNLNQFKIAIAILNKFKLKFVYSSENLERKSIAIIPDYLENYDFENISCVKITNNSNIKLLHKDYMGAIYNIGIAEDMIGDIIVEENSAYIFLISKVLEYVLLNFSKVGSAKITLEKNDDEVKFLYNFEEVAITVKSLRIDIILSHLYKLSRNDVDKKISKGDLVINSKLIKNKTNLIKENDIVSFSRCGKFKYIGLIKITKTGNSVISINKYK